MSSLKQIEVIYGNRSVGRLALTKEGLCAFEYSAEWLGSGFSISPFELPLRSGVFIAKPSPFDGGFGVFDDCLPDGWGLLILDRYLQQNGVNPRSLSLLDRLAIVGSTGRGALEFRPDKSAVTEQEYADFERLALEAERILDSDDYMGKGIEEFQHRGGSPGGARPKIFARYAGKEWLVKFRAKGDSKRIGVDEYRYSLLAKECGIEMPTTRLFEDKYFGVERFDRTPEGKWLVVSVAGLLGADYRMPSIDYTHIFQVCAALTHSMAEMWKVYRLMVFNYLIGNKDDHAKNFAFIYRGGDWHFAPAYDLLPSDGINGFRTTSINDNVEPSKDDVLAVALKAGLNKKKAEEVFDRMQKLISRHQKAMKKNNLKQKNRIQIQHYHSPCGELLLGSFGDKLCLCDWAKERPRDIVDKRLRKILQADYDESPSSVIQEACRQLDEYFAGERTMFDVPLLFIGTEFQQKVWQGLLAIPYGKTISYGELAKALGCPKAVRAVANANGANAISIFVPCHRVIGSDHSLKGYAGGLATKQTLLQLEQVLV